MNIFIKILSLSVLLSAMNTFAANDVNKHLGPAKTAAATTPEVASTTAAQSFEPVISKPIILSGFDDVLRQAENTGLWKAALKIFEKDQTFTGMSDLYQVISHERTDIPFFLISAISSWFDSRIDQFLQASHYPTNQRFLRNWFTEWSIEKFKTERIAAILAAHPNDKFIVIFDNSDASIELARTLHSKFSQNIEMIYLREVVAKELPAGSLGFYSAFDIALQEYKAQRLAFSELNEIAQVILQENTKENLFPTYALCPKDYNPCVEIPSQSLALCEQVRGHIQNFCAPH